MGFFSQNMRSSHTTCVLTLHSTSRPTFCFDTDANEKLRQDFMIKLLTAELLEMLKAQDLRQAMLQTLKVKMACLDHFDNLRILKYAGGLEALLSLQVPESIKILFGAQITEVDNGSYYYSYPSDAPSTTSAPSPTPARRKLSDDSRRLVHHMKDNKNLPRQLQFDDVGGIVDDICYPNYNNGYPYGNNGYPYGPRKLDHEDGYRDYDDCDIFQGFLEVAIDLVDGFAPTCDCCKKAQEEAAAILPSVTNSQLEGVMNIRDELLKYDSYEEKLH